jgi:hypothetical protein
MEIADIFIPTSPLPSSDDEIRESNVHFEQMMAPISDSEEFAQRLLEASRQTLRIQIQRELRELTGTR